MVSTARTRVGALTHVSSSRTSGSRGAILTDHAQVLPFESAIPPSEESDIREKFTRTPSPL